MTVKQADAINNRLKSMKQSSDSIKVVLDSLKKQISVFMPP